MNRTICMVCGVLLCLLSALSLFILAGCEGSANEDVSGAEAYFDNNPYSSTPRTDPGAQDLELRPDSYAVSFINQEVAFTVTGGEGDYRWYVSNHANGDINSHGANQAVYVVKQLAANSITVQDDLGHYAVAYITIGSTTISVSPGSITLSAGQLQASFTVSGGTAPYTWTSGNVQLGTVSYSAGSSHVAAYTAVSGASGQNVITVRDAEGRIASATITQS